MIIEGQSEAVFLSVTWGIVRRRKKMKRTSFEVLKCIVVLAMLMPAASLAHVHRGNSNDLYSPVPGAPLLVVVEPTTVASGGTISVSFSYTISHDPDHDPVECPWEIWLDDVQFPPYPPGPQRDGVALLASGSKTHDPTVEVTQTFDVLATDLPIPVGLEGQYYIKIVSSVELIAVNPNGQDTWDTGVGRIAYNDFDGGLPIPITIEASPSVLVENLVDEVVALNLQNGIENSLDAKLDAALNALDDLNENNDVAAINSLEAFINAVEAQSGNKILAEDAATLISKAQQIIDLILSG
ncbi:MAG: hypothetical protein ACYSWQ_14060 [Planctomycetota bacterium]